tara:strand:+ start:1122 stop:1523 length:402 start_codon:yes stop_codon:yes gene_type:complete
MSYIYKNITGLSAQKLLSANDYKAYLTSINLANTHETDIAYVDLYITRTYDSTSEERLFVGDNNNWNALETTTETYYIINSLAIPSRVSVLLEKDELKFDYTLYDLYIKLDASDSAVDVIINIEEEINSQTEY